MMHNHISIAKVIHRLFSAANFGAAFRIPGFVTIGPNMRVTGSIAGEATLHA